MSVTIELREDNALGFLDGRVGLSNRATARPLAGGVSNTVLLIEDGCQRIVLKQSLPRLRVRDEWLADRARVVREWEVMQALGAILPRGRLPELLFLDAQNCLYAMRAAAQGYADWKTRLLAGECDAATARQAGATLGLTVRGTWRDRGLEESFSDRTAFDQLRTDPYYRTVAARHPLLAARVEEWIAECAARNVALVHGDWSPKNLLVNPGGIVCIDFECAHFGDPSYDAGFLLNHLILKAFRRPELAASYLRLARTAFCWTLGTLPAEALAWFEDASMRHLAFLMLARVDGKSPAEYLQGESVRGAVRQLALQLLDERPRTLNAVLGRAERAVQAAPGSSSTGRP